MSDRTKEAALLVAEGKTKFVYDVGDGMARLEAKDDITAGDGAKHDRFDGKARFSTQTTCNVLKLLKTCGVAVAFDHQTGPQSFVGQLCEMLPYEVVVRRRLPKAASYLKRHPETDPSTVFDPLVVEFFLKTSGKNFRGIEVPKDDPLIVRYGATGIIVTRPDMPEGEDNPRVIIPGHILLGRGPIHPHQTMMTIAQDAFIVLENAWQQQNCTLCDLKVEFGFDHQGVLRLADVIDNDSWRLLDPIGDHLDKQRYRDGEELALVAKLYAEVANRTMKFVPLCHDHVFLKSAHAHK